MIWLNDYIDPRVQQALIAGVFLAAGWLVNGRQNRRRDARLREERVRDVQRALFAEIRAYVAVLKRDNLAVYGETIARRILAEKDYFPIIPTERNDTIFRAIVADIHILPRAVVDPAALYYSQLAAISAMIDDLRVLDKGRIGPERAVAMYRDYIAMKQEALELGEDAMLMMGAFLSGGRERVAQIETTRQQEEEERLAGLKPQIRAELDAIRSKISSPDAGLSDL